MLTQTYNVIKVNTLVSPKHILFFLNSRPLLMWSFPIPKTLLPLIISLLDSTLCESFPFSVLDISPSFCLLCRQLNYNFINIFIFLLYFSYITQEAIILVNDSIFYGALITMYKCMINTGQYIWLCMWKCQETSLDP